MTNFKRVNGIHHKKWICIQHFIDCVGCRLDRKWMASSYDYAIAPFIKEPSDTNDVIENPFLAKFSLAFKHFRDTIDRKNYNDNRRLFSKDDVPYSRVASKAVERSSLNLQPVSDWRDVWVGDVVFFDNSNQGRSCFGIVVGISSGVLGASYNVVTCNANDVVVNNLCIWADFVDVFRLGWPEVFNL